MGDQTYYLGETCMTLNWESGVSIWISDGEDRPPKDLDNYVGWRNHKRHGYITKNTGSVESAESYIRHALSFYPEGLGDVFFYDVVGAI